MSETIALLAVVAIAVAARAATGTWLHPAAFFPAIWALCLGVTKLLLADVYSYGNASWLIVAACFIAASSAPFSVRQTEAHPKIVASSPWLRRFALLGGVSGIASALVSLQANGRSVSQLSVQDIINSAQAMTAARYNGSLESPLIATLLLAVTYGAAFIAPFSTDQTGKLKNALILSAPSLGGAAYAVLTTARAGLLIAASITLGSWIIVKAIQAGGRAQIRLRSIMPLIVAGGGIVFLFVFVAALRYGGFAFTNPATIVRTIGIYAGASTPALNAWLPEASAPELGAETFAGVAQFIVSAELGVTEFVNIGPEHATNVFTAFRSLVEDFTIPGAIIFIGIASVIASICYRHATIRGSLPAAVIAAAWAGFVVFSQSASIFSFTNVTLGVVAGAFAVCRLAEIIPRSEDAVADAGGGPPALSEPQRGDLTMSVPKSHRTAS